VVPGWTSRFPFLRPADSVTEPLHAESVAAVVLGDRADVDGELVDGLLARIERFEWHLRLLATHKDGYTVLAEDVGQ
jgi:hypothetical protein